MNQFVGFILEAGSPQVLVVDTHPLGQQLEEELKELNSLDYHAFISQDDPVSVDSAHNFG